MSQPGSSAGSAAPATPHPGHALVTSAQGYGAYSQVYFVNKNSSISVYTTLEEPEKAESEDPQNYANTYIRLKGSTSNIKVASKDLAALAWQKKNGDQSTTRTRIYYVDETSQLQELCCDANSREWYQGSLGGKVKVTVAKGSPISCHINYQYNTLKVYYYKDGRDRPSVVFVTVDQENWQPKDI